MERAALLHLGEPGFLVVRGARGDAVGKEVHFEAAREKVVRRLIDADVRLNAADDALARAVASSAATNSGAPQELNAVFSMASKRAGNTSRISPAVRPKPFGYCSVTSSGMCRICAACAIKAMRAEVSAKSEIEGRKPSCISMITSAARAASSVFSCRIRFSFGRIHLSTRRAFGKTRRTEGSRQRAVSRMVSKETELLGFQI